MGNYVSSRDSVLYYEKTVGVFDIIGFKQTANEFNSEVDIKQRAGMTDAEWTKTYGRLNRSGSSESIETFDNAGDTGESVYETLFMLQQNRQTLKLRKMVGTTRYMEIEALIESVNLSASDDEDATCSVSWQGTGAVTFGDLPAVVPAP